MDYTPDQVDYWLRNWPLLLSLSETPASSSHLLSSECRAGDRACSNGRPVGIRDVRNHGDPMRYVDLLADLRAAAEQLPAHSLESQVIARRIATGDWVDRIAKQLRTDQHRVRDAYRSACKLMAKSLGWDEGVNGESQGLEQAR